MLKTQEKQLAIAQGRPERRLNHETGDFLNEPATGKARRKYASAYQYTSVQQYWAQPYMGALEPPPGLVADAENLNRLHRALRPDAADFVPRGI